MTKLPPLKYREYMYFETGELMGMKFLTKLPEGARKVLSNPDIWELNTKACKYFGVYSKICRMDWNGHFGQNPDSWVPG